MILSNYRIRALVLFLILCSPNLIHAQSSSISLDEAVEMFRNNSLERMLLGYDREAQQGNAQSYKAYPNPEIRVYRESLNAGTPIYNETTVQISQPLELLGQPFLRNKSASALSEAARLGFDYQEQALVARLRSLYVQHWYISERLAVVNQALQTVHEVRQSALARKEEGTYSTVQLLRFNIEYGKYLRLRDEIQSELTHTKSRLILLLASDDTKAEDIMFTESFSVDAVAYTEESIIEYALHHRRDLKQIEQLIVAKDLQYDVERRERFPDLNLDLGYKSQSNGSEGLVIGGSLKLPLFNQNKGNVIKTRAQARGTAIELELKKITIRNEVIATFQKVSLLQKQWKDMQGLSGNVSLLETARISYQEGAYSLLELLDATEAYLEGQTLFYQTITEYNQALFQLDLLSGGKLFSNQ